MTCEVVRLRLQQVDHEYVHRWGDDSLDNCEVVEIDCAHHGQNDQLRVEYLVVGLAPLQEL